MTKGHAAHARASMRKACATYARLRGVESHPATRAGKRKERAKSQAMRAILRAVSASVRDVAMVSRKLRVIDRARRRARIRGGREALCDLRRLMLVQNSIVNSAAPSRALISAWEEASEHQWAASLNLPYSNTRCPLSGERPSRLASPLCIVNNVCYDATLLVAHLRNELDKTRHRLPSCSGGFMHRNHLRDMVRTAEGVLLRKDRARNVMRFTVPEYQRPPCTRVVCEGRVGTLSVYLSVDCIGPSLEHPEQNPTCRFCVAVGIGDSKKWRTRLVMRADGAGTAPECSVQSSSGAQAVQMWRSLASECLAPLPDTMADVRAWGTTMLPFLMKLARGADPVAMTKALTQRGAEEGACGEHICRVLAEITMRRPSVLHRGGVRAERAGMDVAVTA